MILLPHRIQIQTLILLIEQSKTLKCVWVHFRCIKGKLQWFLRGRINQVHTYEVLFRHGKISKDRKRGKVTTNLDVLDDALKVAISLYDGF